MCVIFSTPSKKILYEPCLVPPTPSLRSDSSLHRRFLNRLVDSVDYQLLEKHCDAVGALLESSPHLKDKIGFDVFERLFRSVVL